MGEPVARHGLTSGPSLPSALNEPRHPGLPPKPCLERALSGQQRSQRLPAKCCRYATLECGKHARIAWRPVRD